MSVVDGVGTRGETGRVHRFRAGRAAQSADSAFILPGNSLASPSHGLAADAPPVSMAPVQLDGVLGIQGRGAAFSEDGSGGDRPGRRQVLALLAELSALQRILLGGGGADMAAHRLNAILEMPPFAVPPGLFSVLAAVRLRAKVELARRGLAGNR